MAVRCSKLSPLKPPDRIAVVTPSRRRQLMIPLAVLASMVLGACGGTFHAPAAVVNGFEISQGRLDEQVDLALTDPTLAAQVEGTEGAERRAELTRQVLSFLIRQHIIETYARTNRITVAESEVDAEVAATVDQVGGQEAFDRELATRGLTEDDVRDNIRRGLLTNKVVQAVGEEQLPGTAEATPEELNQAFGQWLRDQAAAADIEINPRFGAFDLEQISVCRVVSTAGDTSCPAA
jgi:hypothetical protein